MGKLKAALLTSEKEKGLTLSLTLPRIQVFDDGTIFEDELLLSDDSQWPCLVLVCRTVGSAQMKGDPTFKKGLLNLFKTPGFLALGAGDSGVSAHCFIGLVESESTSTCSSEDQCHDDSSASNPVTDSFLLHFDPHLTLLPALESDDRHPSSRVEPLRTPQGRLALARKCMGRLRAENVNESFCVALLVKSEEHWKTKVKRGITRESGVNEVIEVMAKNPVNLGNFEERCEWEDDVM